MITQRLARLAYNITISIQQKNVSSKMFIDRFTKLFSQRIHWIYFFLLQKEAKLVNGDQTLTIIKKLSSIFFDPIWYNHFFLIKFVNSISTDI